MVGIFARLAGEKSGHRRTNSAIEVTESVTANVEAGGSTTTQAASHGAEAAVAFRPVEHPVEPLIHDLPVICPLPEPSILNDGRRTWKERMPSASSSARSELPVVKEGSHLESETGGAKPQRAAPRRVILPSISAPENSILTLLEGPDTAKNASDW